MRRRCELLDVNRSMLYYEPVPDTEETLELMRLIDEQYTATPFFGARRIREKLKEKGWTVTRKRIRRLMRKMGLEAIYPKPKTSKRNVSHTVYPYLLRGLTIDKPDQVWCTDVTYIPMHRGFVYLIAVMDWHSRYVLSWELSNSLDTSFCIDALKTALNLGKPEIFNTDQGSQFTAEDFLKPLKEAGVKISMDGKGRWMDNVFVERLWRSLKYEEVYLHAYENVKEARLSIGRWINFYNYERPHQALDYKTPYEIYENGCRLRLPTIATDAALLATPQPGISLIDPGAPLMVSSLNN
jgi:putative transposase